jgi:hypothetical protein
MDFGRGVWVITALAIVASCTSRSRPAQRAAPDPTQEPWYGQTVAQLVGLNQEAADLFRRGERDGAAAAIKKGEPIAARLLAAPRPTLAAMEAAADLDDLYGRMLLSNKHYGWARMLFQKNLARWRTWRPETEETLRRKKLAEAQIDECDRRLAASDTR